MLSRHAMAQLGAEVIRDPTKAQPARWVGLYHLQHIRASKDGKGMEATALIGIDYEHGFAYRPKAGPPPDVPSCPLCEDWYVFMR